jgi:hypothetical protein
LRSIFVALVVLTFQMPWVAHAHDGDPRLELAAERMRPGAVLEVRGINIAPELPVTLTLVGSGGEFALGTALGDEHGDFIFAVSLPAEAIAGAYTVRAFGANRVMASAALELVGAPVAPDGEGGQRAEDEPLLAPLPQQRPAMPEPTGGPAPAPVQPTVIRSLPAVSGAASASATPQSSRIAVWLIVGLIAAIATVGLLTIGWRRMQEVRGAPR